MPAPPERTQLRALTSQSRLEAASSISVGGPTATPAQSVDIASAAKQSAHLTVHQDPTYPSILAVVPIVLARHGRVGPVILLPLLLALSSTRAALVARRRRHAGLDDVGSGLLTVDEHLVARGVVSVAIGVALDVVGAGQPPDTVVAPLVLHADADEPECNSVSQRHTTCCNESHTTAPVGRQCR